MIFTKTIQIDNTDGSGNRLLISATPRFDFLQNITTVRITYLSASDISKLFEEFTSFNQIINANQSITQSFFVPIKKGNLSVDILIHSKSEGVTDFYIEKQP